MIERKANNQPRYQRPVANDYLARYICSMNKIKTIVFGLFVFSSVFAFGDVFTYSLKGFPKEERSCHLQAKTVAQQFEAGTKTKVLHVECEKENETGYDFSIDYESTEKLVFTSTDYQMAGIYLKGRHKLFEECKFELPKQISLFEQATGLKSIFGYCRKTEEGNAAKAWEVIVTAIGKSSIQPRLGGFLVFTPTKEITLQEIFNGLKLAIEKQGAFLAALVLHPQFVMSQGSIHYFSENRIDFELDYVTKVGKLEICTQQAQEVKGWFASLDNAPFTVFCGGPEFGEYELNIGSVGEPSFSYKPSIDKFNSFEECELNKPEIISHYSASQTKQFLGGLCSRDTESTKFQVIIFRKTQ